MFQVFENRIGKALTKYERLEIKRDARQNAVFFCRHYFRRASLFIFRLSYFVWALGICLCLIC